MLTTSTMTLSVGSLCSGYGGLELGLELAGWDVELAWFSEIDESTSGVMLANHPGVPNLGDLTEISEVARVDVIAAGFPCQPFSNAGNQKGIDDERWLIDDVCRVARLAQARMLILENVPGLFTANNGDAMARVCQAMAENGFVRWEWGTVRALDVGACHRRERWFCVAVGGSDGGRTVANRN